MPVVGFIDDAGKPVTFEKIAAGAGEFALPRPMILAFAGGYRSADHYGDPSVISVTTLLNPIQQTRLMQRHNIYVRPTDNQWALFGTMGHTLFENARLDTPWGKVNIVRERRLVIERDGQLIGGTFDLLECEGGEWVGNDYKITSAYGVAKMVAEGVKDAKPEYYAQANIYRHMIADPSVREVVPPKRKGGKPTLVPFEHAGLEVSRWRLVAWSRDWKADRGSKCMTLRPYPTNQPVDLTSPQTLIDVPLGKPEGIERYLKERIMVYKASALCDDAGLPACTAKETWNGRRCKDWCAAVGACQQVSARRRNGSPRKVAA